MNKILFNEPKYKIGKEYYKKLIDSAFKIGIGKNKTKKDQEVYDYIVPISIKMAEIYSKYAKVIYRKQSKEFIFLFMDAKEDKEGFALHIKYVERKAMLRKNKIIVPCYKTKQDYWCTVDKSKDFKRLSDIDDL